MKAEEPLRRLSQCRGKAVVETGRESCEDGEK